MFKWLFGRGSEANKTEETRRFGQAHQMVLTRAAELKKEYERTLADPVTNLEIRKTLETYEDPEYIVGCRDIILSTTEDPQFRDAHQVLPVVATMFMTMVDEAFPSNSTATRFSSWADAFSGTRRRELVRFAYIATIGEQNQAGARHPVAFATRIILMTLAANANDDPTSRGVARELLAYIDRMRSR